MKTILILAALLFAGPALAQPYVAVDGDTLAFGQERIRILGLDTPETYQAQCDQELTKGYHAAGRLQHLLNTRRVRVERSSRRDKYGRTLARVWVGEDEVPTILIREGLARPYDGGKRQPWCPGAMALEGTY